MKYLFTVLLIIFSAQTALTADFNPKGFKKKCLKRELVHCILREGNSMECRLHALSMCKKDSDE